MTRRMPDDVQNFEAKPNRIEPWKEPQTLLNFYPSERETKGTLVRYRGRTVRARGAYCSDLASALIASFRHADFEGVHS